MDTITSSSAASSVASLVPRYVDLVYATARRLVGDGHLAEDVTQATFVLLMRRVDRVDPRRLPGWLVTAARLAAREALRSQGRRRTHERRAAQLRSELGNQDDGDPTIAQVLPLLDEALSHLSAVDRTAVVVRFLQGRSFAEVGSTIGTTEEAARKRVGRAVEKLRQILIRQGATPSPGGLAIILAAQQAPPAPATAVASATAPPTPAVASLAGRSLRQLRWTHAKATAAIVLGSLGGIAAAVGVVLAVKVLTDAAPPTQHIAATRAAPSTARAKLDEATALAELNQTYALAADQVLRLIEPPFSAARTDWTDAHWPNARGAAHVHSLGFAFGSAGLQPTYLSYVDQSLPEIVTLALGEPWYAADGLNAVPWADVWGDFVIRADATDDQRFAALAGLITRRTGVRVRFVERTADRPCVVLRGATRAGPDSGGHFPTVVLSRKLLTRDQVIAWGRGKRPRGSTHAFQFDAACQSLDAPFFTDPATTFEHGEFRWNTLFPIGPDAILHRSDPGYETALRQVLDNVQAQIGGEFAIERRPITTFTLERVP